MIKCTLTLGKSDAAYLPYLLLQLGHLLKISFARSTIL